MSKSGKRLIESAQQALQYALVQKHDTLTSIYDDDAKDLQAAYEAAFVQEYGMLPDDGYMIASFEVINGNYLFIHNDKH
jgi:hypothetical protein